VRSHADKYDGYPPEPGAIAWVDAERILTQAELSNVDGPPARRLVRSGDPWATCRNGIVTALVTGGSAVVAVGGDADQVTRIANSERVATRCAPERFPGTNRPLLPTTWDLCPTGEDGWQDKQHAERPCDVGEYRRQ